MSGAVSSAGTGAGRLPGSEAEIGTRELPGTGTEIGMRELVEAGAVLPPGADGDDERVVPLTTRAYRHPGLDGRVVVRLVAEELGAAEDAAAGFLGLEPAGEPAVVGLGLRRSLGFPEWVLVHHPRDGHHALAVVPELERTARQARSKPKAALDTFRRLAAQLAVSVPHFLPTFFEQAGRLFLAVDNLTYAAQMFTQARKAEAEHGLPVDEKRLDEVFLEFALAGVLPVKALSGYARELAARVPAEEALLRFRRLCVRRTAAGLAPSAQIAADLRRLARAAGRDVDAEERSYLAELLGMPPVAGAPLGWWKAHRPALVAMARQDPEIRGTLLNLMPHDGGGGMSGFWLELLEESGATAGLGDGEVSGQERPADGTVGWLGRFLKIWRLGRREELRSPDLYALVERVAGRLRAELAGPGRALDATFDVDLLDLLLSLDVPVADPGERMWLRLEQWAEKGTRRDLLALAADTRFRPAFHQAADRFDDDEDGLRAIRRLAASPGGRPMLAEWMRTVTRRSSAVGLPQLPAALGRLTWLPAEALLLAEREVAAITRTDLAAELARTLRGGLLDELGWPVWEEAVAALAGPGGIGEITVADAWPHLIVSGPSQVRVIGAEGAVLTHDLRSRPDDAYSSPGFHYVDGELLVYWNTYGQTPDLRGYWHSSAGELRTMEAQGNRWELRGDRVTLPLPAGGRTTGAGVLHPGDTVLPASGHLSSDGTSFWAWDPDEGWREYDPVGMAYGRKSMPGFLADALRSAPAGSTFREGRLLPAPSGEATPAGVPVGGLLGWRVVELPDGSLRGEDLAGRTVTLNGGPHEPLPVLAVTFPGDDRPRAVTGRHRDVALVDPERVVTATVSVNGSPGVFAAGTALLPPLRYWHFLGPRDPEGSSALRRIDEETAAALLKGAGLVESADPGQPGQPGSEELRALVRTLLPQVGHDALIAGIAGTARFAAALQTTLDTVAARLAGALAGEREEEQEPTGPSDELLAHALNGLDVSSTSWYGEEHSVFGWLGVVGRALRAPSGQAVSGQAVRLHVDGPRLPSSRLRWEPLLDRCAAVAYRAASAALRPEHADALRELLREIDALGPARAAESAPWRRLSLHLDGAWLKDDRRNGHLTGVLPLDGGACAVFHDAEAESDGYRYTVLFHDPAGRFEVPHPYTVRSSGPVGEDREEGWLAEFLAELSERGPAPWRPEAAEEFARLTGVTPTVAGLVVAGMPYVDSYQRTFLPGDSRTALGLKAADLAVARDELRGTDADVRREVVAALLPARPATLWTDGPDVAAAAQVWNARVGRRAAVPEWIIGEAARAVRTDWVPIRALPALVDPAASAELSRDLRWEVHHDRVRAADANAVGFTAATLVGAVALTAWLAHRLPAGDPVRATLPAALAAVRSRLENPDLMLSLSSSSVYADLRGFRKVAGAPTEVAEGWERYGAVIMATHDVQPVPGLRPALLDEAGDDPYLPVLRALTGDAGTPFPEEAALRTARDPRFEALLAEPGDPAAGERAADGTWWPQDPVRSVPALVSEAAREYGLGQDAAALYLTLLAMPDPTDKNVARWTGWKPARFKAARAELAATDLVVEATRTRAGRSIFLPGAWTDLGSPRVPLEQWKVSLLDLISGGRAQLEVIVPIEPAADLYGRAWRRLGGGDAPGFEELRVRRGGRR
ncbi:hypothetical protein FHR32_008305 [Streptosporangium album]|uniref:DNA-binding protein n=1 Tax=Streptosporangium album TaxID=47479 RepID=A0A7W7WF01_9ACTN|nr:DNA-binding protein [Streptosporangium album]MBB4943904.1 hypothetical protein [Streptosporangium album]